jgi:hypothetical protein
MISQEQWALQRQNRRFDEERRQREKKSKELETFGNWLREMRWKLTGPEEEDHKWVKYCGDNSILIIRNWAGGDSVKKNTFWSWKEAKNFEFFEMKYTDEAALVPRDFVKKCLIMGMLPPP